MTWEFMPMELREVKELSCDDNRDSFLESRYEHYRELGKNEKQSQELAWDDYWNEAWEEYDYQDREEEWLEYDLEGELSNDSSNER
jgi:hypothetical protein